MILRAVLERLVIRLSAGTLRLMLQILRLEGGKTKPLHAVASFPVITFNVPFGSFSCSAGGPRWNWTEAENF